MTKKIIRILNSNELQELKELLINKNLTKSERIELFRRKVLNILESGDRTMKYWKLLLLFLFGFGTPAYSAFMAIVRKLFHLNKNDKENVKIFIDYFTNESEGKNALERITETIEDIYP